MAEEDQRNPESVKKAKKEAAIDEGSRGTERSEETQPEDPGVNTAPRASRIQFATVPQPVPTVKVAPATADEKTLRTGLDKFLKSSGYKEDDVLAWNHLTQTAVTKNGGKYLLRKNGKVRHLIGPATPRDRKAAEQPGEDDE